MSLRYTMEVKKIRTNKTNPGIERGDNETSESYLERLDEYISRLEWQSEGHRMWYTHKNPYGCWICELLQITRRLRDNLYLDDGDDSEIIPDESNYDDEVINTTKS